MNKPIANDWERINERTEYSEFLNVFWANGKVYDNRSAVHNGIVGPGAQLKQILKQEQ